MSRIPILDLAAEYEQVGPAVEEAVMRTLRSGRYILGPEVESFEAALAELVGVRHAVGVGSGTEALVLSLMALDVGHGDEVVTTPYTFFASIEAIFLAGARPVFVDIEKDGFNLDAERLADTISPKTKAVMPVHLFGRLADMERIREVSAAAGVPVVEDACQAIGATRGGRGAGGWGATGCFSFYPSKSLGTAGDGGAITTDDTELANRLRSIRFHGQGGGKGHALIGTTSRLDAIQAAVLNAKLPFLKGWIDERSSNAARYIDALRGCPDLVLPDVEADEAPAWSCFVLRTPHADAIRRALDDAEVEWRHYYPRPVYREEAFGDDMLPEGAFPEAERACADSVSVPIYPRLGNDAIDRVCDVILQASRS